MCESVTQWCLTLTPWTVTHQPPLSMEFSTQEYWTGLPFPSLGDLPDPGIEPASPALQTDCLPSESSGKLRIVVCVAIPFCRGSSQPRD